MIAKRHDKQEKNLDILLNDGNDETVAQLDLW